MRITREIDPERGTVRIVVELPLETDPYVGADLAWEHTHRQMAAAQREIGTVPAGLR